MANSVSISGETRIHLCPGDLCSIHTLVQLVDCGHLYYSVHWVCPSEIPSECVLDVTQSVTGELVGVGTGGDVTWWKLREYEVGESIFVEDVTIFKSSELTNDLRRCGYGEYTY